MNTQTQEHDPVFTRKDYMAGRCSHERYYAQFITDVTRSALLWAIPAERIIASTDAHFNDIPLRLWDELPNYVSGRRMEAAGDFPTPAGKVCVYKTLAKQIRREKAHPRKWFLEIRFRDANASSGLDYYHTDATGTIDDILDYYMTGPINLGSGAHDRTVNVIGIGFEPRG